MRFRFAFLLLWFASVSGVAQTNVAVRPLSLPDCIQIALEHNLDIRIERYSPEIARYGLSLAEAGYEPVFTGSGIRRFSFSDNGDQTNLPGTQIKSESVAANIFGAWDVKGGAAGSVMNLVQHPALNHRCEVTSGVRENECRSLLQSFFQNQRNKSVRSLAE